MKYPNYMINILAIWMTLDELEGERTRRYSIDIIGKKETKQFTYQHPFGIHFRYIHQVGNKNNWRHTPIYLERTWTTKFWSGRNFAWYIAVL